MDEHLIGLNPFREIPCQAMNVGQVCVHDDVADKPTVEAALCPCGTLLFNGQAYRTCPTCPQCDSELSVAAATLGRSVLTCPGCGLSIVLTAQLADPGNCPED